MGNPLANRADQALENESMSISAFIALDGSANVIGIYPTTGPAVLTGPYTRGRGLDRSIGQAGAVVTQPHTSAGVYVFTLNDPWFAGTEAWAQLVDQGAVAQLNYGVDVNVTAVTGSSSYGFMPGQNQTLAAQTIRVRFRVAAGTLTDPVASTGFWLGIKLKRTGTV